MRWVILVAVLLCACGRRQKPPAPDPALHALMDRLRPDVARFPAVFDREVGPRLEAIARPAGALGARAIYELLLEHYSGDIHAVFVALDRDDQRDDRPAWLVGELADEDLRATLVKDLTRSDLHEDLRRRIAIALCRKGSPDLMDALVDRAVDRREYENVRRAILERLERVECPPPPRLHDALYLPFDGLDHLAAAALAKMGDPEAPSLVLEGLDGSDRRLLLDVVPRITGEEYPKPDFSTVSELDRRIRADALRNWIDKNRPQTEFEVERRRYLASTQRTRELALRSFEDIVAVGDDFDLASAVLLTTEDKHREQNLERLNRLAYLVRRRIEGVTDPEARIRAMNECLVPSREVCDVRAVESGERSRLDYLLAHDSGTCVAWSCLYLAVADRCGLPLRAVRAPGHMYVRYDDGTFRRNIETTALGEARPDEAYRDGDFGPVDLTARQVVADALNSAACTEAYYECYDKACDLVGKALVLDPGFGMAYLNRARYTLHARLDADDQIVADIEKALPIHTDAAGCRRSAARLLLVLGHVERALALYAESDAIESSSDAKAGRADCLSRLGRFDEARAAAGDQVPLALSVRLSPAEAASAVLASDGSADTCCNVAWELLDLEPPRHEEALKVIDRGISELDGRGGAYPDTVEWVAANRLRRNLLALRARALAGLGRIDEAREALENASKREGSNRQLLEARAAVERAAATAR